MSIRPRFLNIAILLALFTLPASAAVTLQHSGRVILFDENSHNGSPRGFYEFNLQSLGLTLITEVGTPTGTDRFSGFEWNPTNGLVYAGSSEGNLYTISLDDGSFDLVGNVPVNGSAQSEFVRGITFDPNTNQMYGFGFGPRLYQIDAATANADEIGVAPNLSSGLAFTPDGKLWGMNVASQLIQIDSLTGQTITSFSSLSPFLSNLTSLADGTLLGVNWQSGSVVEIDPTTGQSNTLVSYSNHGNGLFGVVFVAVPEPHAVAFLAVAVIGKVVRRNRRPQSTSAKSC